MARIIPARGKIVAKRVVETYLGKIEVPDKHKKKLDVAEVISVGKPTMLDSIELDCVDCKAGDKILVSIHSGTDVRIDGQELVVFEQTDVLGVLED